MLKRLITIKDEATELFTPPVAVDTTAQALRMFADLINNPDTEHNRHPGDFDLYILGVFDPATGKIDSSEPQRLMRGVDAVKKDQNA